MLFIFCLCICFLISSLVLGATGDPCSYTTGDFATPGFSAAVHQWAVDNSPGKCMTESACTQLGPFAAEGHATCNPPPNYSSNDRCCFEQKLWPCKDRTSTETIKYACFDKNLCTDVSQDIKGTVEPEVGQCPGSNNMKCCKVDCQYTQTAPASCAIKNDQCKGTQTKVSTKNALLCPPIAGAEVDCNTCCEHETTFGGAPTGCTLRGDGSCKGTATRAVKAGSSMSCQPLVQTDVICPIEACNGPQEPTKAPTNDTTSCDRQAYPALWAVEVDWITAYGTNCTQPSCEELSVRYWVPKIPLDPINRDCLPQREERVQQCFSGDCAPVVDCQLAPADQNSSWLVQGNCFWREDESCVAQFLLKVETQPSAGGQACPAADAPQRLQLRPCPQGEQGCPAKKLPIDCEVHYVDNWSACEPSCGDGLRRRTQVIKTAPQNGGQECPSLATTSQWCSNGPCPGAYAAAGRRTSAPATTVSSPGLVGSEWVAGVGTVGFLFGLCLAGVILIFVIYYRSRTANKKQVERNQSRDLKPSQPRRSRLGTRRSRSGSLKAPRKSPRQDSGQTDGNDTAMVTIQGPPVGYGRSPGNVGVYKDKPEVERDSGYGNSPGGVGVYSSHRQSFSRGANNNHKRASFV